MMASSKIVVDDQTRPRGVPVGRKQQLLFWVEGTSLHRRTEGYPAGECVPDFSCCDPALLAPVEERRAFANANDTNRVRFLALFLQRAVNHEAQRRNVTPPTVCVVGGEVPEKTS